LIGIAIFANKKTSKMGKYKSTILAKYIAAYWNDKYEDINITKIQKLTYIAYGVFLAVKDERLIDEHPQAWPYGPVFPITRNKLIKLDLNTISFEDKELSEIQKDEEVVELINLVYKTFGSWTASRLSAWSHKEGSPWESAVYTSSGIVYGGVIKDDIIRSYFRKIIISPKETSISNE
jgi:uncharacterized phage-associated protein